MSFSKLSPLSGAGHREAETDDLEYLELLPARAPGTVTTFDLELNVVKNAERTPMLSILEKFQMFPHRFSCSVGHQHDLMQSQEHQGVIYLTVTAICLG